MTTFQFDAVTTTAIALGLLVLGRWLVSHSKLLKTYTIPDPVVGGLVAAVCITLLRLYGEVRIEFDTAIQTPLMLMFFTSIGLGADIPALKQGGKPLVMLLISVIGLLVVQNIVGVGGAVIMGLPPQLGLIAGSITMSGGHGTGAAWGAVFSQDYGITIATELALACATFGLVLGGLLGGPIAHYLMSRLDTPPKLNTASNTNTEAPNDEPTFGQPEAFRRITADRMATTLFLTFAAIIAGLALQKITLGTAWAMPTFVWCLMMGAVIRNALSLSSIYHVEERAVSVMGNVSLSIFLTLALMSLKLWELLALALPILAILTLQVVIMALWAVFVTFRLMGKTYDSVVITAGHCGFGLGATPTAIANMQAITNRFGDSQMAYLLIPLVGAFFIDIANAITIKLWLLAM